MGARRSTRCARRSARRATASLWRTSTGGSCPSCNRRRSWVVRSAARAYLDRLTGSAAALGSAMSPTKRNPEERPVGALLAPDLLAMLEEDPSLIAAETEELHPAD